MHSVLIITHCLLHNSMRAGNKSLVGRTLLSVAAAAVLVVVVDLVSDLPLPRFFPALSPLH